MERKTIDRFRGDYFFLSNFSPTLIIYEGIHYSTVEAAFQAAKSLDEDVRRRIAQYSPADARSYGRHIKLRPDWEDVKVDIMRDLLRLKFADDRFGNRTRLLATGDTELIEGNTHGDQFWGACKGEGKNILGKLLMEIRKEIRESQK